MRSPAFWAGIAFGVAVYPGTSLAVRLILRQSPIYPR